MNLITIDYVANSPIEELRLGLQRTPSETYGDFGSLEGRLVCALKVGVHTASIVLKPLHYLVAGAVVPAFFNLINAVAANPDLLAQNPDLESQIRELDNGPVQVSAFTDNPELQERFSVLTNGMLLAAPFVIISQIIQVFKAILGVIHPGIYFRNDELAPFFRRLTHVALEVGCSPDLIEKLEQGSKIVYRSILHFRNPEYYEAEYRNDLEVICEKLEDPLLPASRKLCVLSLLNPEPPGSGIESCPGGLGRTFRLMRANIEVPENPAEILPWLTAQFKGEVINRMILQSETTHNTPNRPQWHRQIARLAYDPVHRGNALIVDIGRDVGLDEATILRAEHDPIANRIAPLPDSEKQTLITAFNTLCTEEALLEALLEKVNSQPDGSPGLATFRDHVIQFLSEHLTQEQIDAAEEEDLDPTIYAIRLYYLKGGEGDPSDPGFNNLNADAIHRYTQLLEQQA